MNDARALVLAESKIGSGTLTPTVATRRDAGNAPQTDAFDWSTVSRITNQRCEGELARIIYRSDADAIVILEVFSKKSERRLDRLSTHASGESRNMTMRKEKKKRLEAKGWKIGTAKDFLGLSQEESAYITLGASDRELSKIIATPPRRVTLIRFGQ